MFTYIINDEKVTFSSLEEAIPALEKAEELGYTIEEVTGEKKKPKKKEEEKDPILASIEANTPKEDFTQGPVESADAASETVAPSDTALPPESTFSDSPSSDKGTTGKTVKIGNQSYPAIDIVEKIRSGEFKISGDISSELYEWSNGENKGIKEGVTDETLLNAYIDKFPNAQLIDDFEGGTLDEVILGTGIDVGEEGSSLFPDPQDLADNLSGTDFDEQKSMYEYMASLDPNVSVTYDAVGVQKDNKGDVARYKSKNVFLNHTDPKTNKVSTVRINEDLSPEEKAAKVIDFGNKYISYQAAAKLADNSRIVSNLSKPGGPLYVKPATIDAQFPNQGKMFDSYTKTVTSPGSGQYGMANVKEVRVFPYKDELAAAREAILEKNPDKTPEELDTESKIQVLANLKAAKKTEIIKKRAENLIDGTRGSIFQLDTGIDTKTQGALLFSKASKSSKISKDSQVNSAAFDANLDIANTTSSALEDINDYLNGQSINKTDIRLSDGDIIKLGVADGSPMMISKAGVKITTNQLLQVQKEHAALTAASTELQKLYSKGTELNEEYKELQPSLAAVKLDYNLAEKYATSFGLGVTDIGAGLLYASYTLAKYTSPLGLINTVDSTLDNAVNELAVKYKRSTDEVRASFVSDVSVDDAFSGGANFGKFVVQEIMAQGPVLLAMAASGGTAAPYVVGAWTAGGEGIDITYQDSLSGKKTGEMEKVFSMMGIGLANGVFTSLTTNPILQRGLKTYRADGLGKEYLLGTRDYISQNWKRAIVGDNVMETAGEVATNVVENAIHGRPIFENVEHVVLSSVGFSFAFSTAPFIRGAALRYYNSTPAQKRMDARIREIISLQKNIDAAYEASEKYGTGSFTEESGAVTQMKDRIAVLQEQNGVAIEKLQKNVGSKIDNQGAMGFQAVMNTLNGFKQRASVVVNDKRITPANKSKMLGELEAEFEMYHGIRKHFLDEATFGENFYLLEATDNATYERLINEAKIITKKTEGMDRKLPPVVIEKAIELYNRERIAENNAAAKKVDKNFQSFETVDDAIVYMLTELGDKITPETAAEVEQNILDGGAGAAIPLLDGTVVPIAIVENQLTEGKTSVSIHEVGHPIVSKIFKNNPDQMIEFADNIDAWLQENNPGLAARMLLNINSYQTRPKQEIAEEKLMAFFEMVADNKVDLNSKANASFSAVLAYNLQEIAGGSYNFNFKGPEEFAAFAAAIGTKIKNGDLSFKEVSMLSTKIKPPTTATPTKKAEPTVKKSAPLQAKFDEAEDALNDAEDMFNLDPNDPSLKKAVEVAQEAYDLAEAALDAGPVAAETTGEATPEAESVKKEKIVRPKADKSKRKYSLDTEVKKEIEPKIAEVQAINKVIKAEEKRLNAEAKQAIEDQPEVGDVTRTSKEKQLVELKENPVTINSNNSPDVAKQAAKRDKLQNEIVKALDVPISKAANLFTNVFYNKISSNAKQAVSREEYLASAKANLTVMTINEFKPETINRKGENVINDIEDIIFQRGGLRAVKFAEDLGVVGKDQGTSRGAEALVKMASGDIEFEFDTKDSKKSEKKLVSGFKGEVRRPSALLANEKLTKEAKDKIIEFWEKNRGNKKVENFKNLPVVIDALLAEIYGVSEGTLTARSGNFNKETYKSAITAFTEKQAVFRTELNGEMTEVRVPYDQRDSKLAELEAKAKEDSNFTFEEYAPESRGEGILRFLPELSVPEYKYFSGKRGRSAGKSTGMPKNFTDLAYLVTGRRTQAQGNREGEIQKMSRQELLEAIGAIDDGNGNAVPDLAAAREAGKAPNKMPGAQTLLSLIKLEGRMIANEMSREFGNLDPMTALDIEMGKNPAMYSKAIIKGSFVLEGNNLLVDGINTALAAEFGDYKNANLANVVDFIYKKLKADYPNNAGVAKLFTYEYVDQLKKSGDVSDTEIKEVVSKAAGKAYGHAYKYALTEVALNKTWDKLVGLKSKEVSDANKKEQIKTFLRLFGRTFTNEKFLGMTTNEQLFAELAKATGLGVKGLKNLGFALNKEPGVNPKTEKEQINSYITLDKKVIEKPTGTDYIKKMVASGKVSSVNKAGGILNSEAVKNREDILSVIDPLIKDGNLTEANEMLALMTLGTNALVRKVSSLGKFIQVSPKDTKFVLEHETAAKLIEDQYRDYINNRGSDLAKANLDAFLDSAYVNVISLSLDEVLLPKVGGPERMAARKPKALINKAFVIDYAAQLQKQANNIAKQLPKNLRVKEASLQAVTKQSRALNKAITLGNSLNQPTKGISIWDFDDTLATTKSNVLFTMPDGTKGKIAASEFAKKGDAMLADGAKFDFSEFSKVMNGGKGPFFNKAVDRNRKFGNKDVYILTARPANSANAIHEFLKGIGLDIPLANITGLASSDPQAKANWVVGKFAEGYNDFYFADDHVGNVNAVSTALSALDNVKSNVELAKAARYSKKIRAEYSTILDKLRGGDVIEGNKVFSAEQQIDEVFDWVNSLNIPEKNKGKYKRAALNFVAKSPTNFPVDAEIVNEAMRIAELKKLDVMNFNNPREIIDKFAGEVKAKRLDPNKEKQFFNKKSLPEGVETFQIMPNRWGQLAVRKMLDTHWGEKTNPWCVTAQESGYTAAEQKEIKENPPGIPIGTKVEVVYEAIVNAGVVENYITFDNMGNRVEDVMFDFIGNLKPGWVAGEADYDSANPEDQIVIDRENEQDFNEELAQYKAEGYKIRKDSYDPGDFYVQMERNNDPEVNKVRKYISYYQTKNPNMTQEEFDNGPAKGGVVKNPEIEPTGPVELTFGSRQMWRSYGKPISREFVNEDTGDVEIDDGGFEIAFKDGKLLALKNLGGQKQQWFDRMDKGTDQLALNVPRDAKGNITGQSTMMNTDSGRVFKKDYTTRYSKKIEPTLNNLINELSVKGDAVNSSTTNLRAQPKEVKEVINTLDVKSDTQQARVRYSAPLSKRFNEIIEEKTGIESFKEYESVKAAKKGAKKGRFDFFIPPSAEDFVGLLYKTLPKGKKGESAMAFYKEHLIDPYWKGVSALRTQRIAIGKEYRALKNELGIVPRKLKKTFEYEDENGNMKESLFTKEDAIRVYVWDAQGLDVEGLSNVDLPILVNYVNANPDLKAFANKLLELNKNNEPKAPTKGWPAGTITSDLLNTLNTEGRKQLLEVWQQNADAIFTEANFNKLEAAFGKSYVRSLKSSLDAMKTGKSSKPTGNPTTDGFVKWINAAVGNIMFFNRRSAVLQLISFTNFVNFEGNNLYQAGKAFANQPQYWKDWVYLMNSDYLVDRRDGLKINVNEADLATTAKENGFQGVLAKILQTGFIPTKYADSVAIATGGASFYRNKVNALIKGGMNRVAAEKQAMQEFIQVAETSQQSSDPAMTSKQQREPIGRIILAFANTPSQYARIIKKSTQDLIAGRGNPRTHLSRIVYYGGIQNVVFNFLQQAMFAAMMGDDDEEEDEEATAAKEASMTKKSLKVANSMSDGILRGLGIGGAVVSVVKNLAIKLYERSQKTRNQNLAATIKDEVMKISPPISSKLSKMGKVGNAFEWGKKEIEFDEMSLKHPYVTAATNAVAAVTGLPLDRAQSMAIDAADIASSETETWMKPLIALGWPKWQLMSDEDTKKEKEEKKERFKELEADRDFQELDPTNQRRAVIKKLSKKEQEDILWNSGVLTRKQIRNLKNEANRVDKIMGLQDKKQFEKDMEALSKGKEIGEMPKIERPKKRKDSLK